MSGPERIDPCTCIGCGEKITGRLEVGGTTHEDVDGDVSICAYCATVAIYDAGAPGGLRPPTDAEAFALEVDDAVQAAVADVKRWQLRQQAHLN